MRIIGTLPSPRDAQLFSALLTTKGIAHEIETLENSDWGSDEYGISTLTVWVIDEDRAEEAHGYLNEFKTSPTPSSLSEHHSLSGTTVVGHNKKIISLQEPSLQGSSFKKTPSPSVLPRKQNEKGILTFIILGVCCLLFFMSEATQPTIPYGQLNHAFYPALSISPVNRPLMYDHPAAFDFLDKAVSLYGVESLEDPNTLPVPGKMLVQKYLQTPYWQGIYDQVIVHFRNANAPWNFNVPLFEKIRQGEVWRLFTPALLHYDLLHIFFNMAWLLMLGRQIESRIKGMRYLLLILIAGILSNTAQYLMSGSNFIGFSGVVCAMITFIWVRQRNAAWEGYQLERSSLIFVGVFLLSIVLLQAVSFAVELTGSASFTPGIANTAHLVGAVVGYLIGRLPFFAWR